MAPEDLKELLLCGLLMLVSLSFVIGGLTAQKYGRCRLDRVDKVVNVAYVAGCEAFKIRGRLYEAR